MTSQNRKHKHINEAETILKRQLEKEDYKEIKNIITSNETSIKKLLQQHEFKKFTCLKWKPRSAVKTVNNTMNESKQQKSNLEQPSQATHKH